jgi:ribonuclease BN (tRNA processing enzyme)
MRFLFLGSGSAYTVGGDNFQSNMLLIAESGKRLLIDCGSDIRWSLAKHGLSYLDVTDIYISHLHSDHVGGLEYIGFKRHYDPRCDRPCLYVETSLVDPLWNHSLVGGMGIISGEDTKLETFFDVHSVTAGKSFQWEGARLEPVTMIHVSGERRTLHSFGLMIENEGCRMFLTTDTQYSPDHLAEYYSRADLIFHDCEIGPVKTGVHPHYERLVQLPEAVRAKTWLYGYQPGALPDAVADGFCGFVRAGQSFDLVSNRSQLAEA